MPDQSSQPTSDEPPVRVTRDGRITTDDAAGAEARSVQTRPGQTEPVNENNGAGGWPLTADPADVAPGGASRGGVDDPRRPGDPAKGADADEGAMANDPDPRQARS